MSAVEDLLARHIAAGTIPGAVAVLGREQPEVVATGTAAVDGPPLRDDAIMRIQSMTKAVWAVAALRLVEAGRLELDASVGQWLPELADRRVLVNPAAELDDTVPAVRPITLRHLLTLGCGYGMIISDSPLARAMRENGTEAGPDTLPTFGADEWLARLTSLPLAFQPGEGWRYHHSFPILGILLARVTGDLPGHLMQDLFGPLGMTDTGLWVPEGQVDRLPAAYRYAGDELVEVEPAGGGFYAGPPPFDVSHGELVSTVPDYARFLAALDGGGSPDGRSLITAEHYQQMTSDQVPAANKTEDSFFPGFWSSTGWGYGVGVDTKGPRSGRYGWSGGQGTTFFVVPGGPIGILLTQVELDQRLFALFEEFNELADAPGAA
jgi:CubicO group peptidase (beta-lactamase class C family)